MAGLAPAHGGAPPDRSAGALSILLGWLGGLALALLQALRTCARPGLGSGLCRCISRFTRAGALILVYYALPFAGLSLSAFASATLALAAVSSAYTSEIVRAGIEAVPKGRRERVLGRASRKFCV